jgi:hypothetical protein
MKRIIRGIWLRCRYVDAVLLLSVIWRAADELERYSRVNGPPGNNEAESGRCWNGREVTRGCFETQAMVSNGE